MTLKEKLEVLSPIQTVKSIEDFKCADLLLSYENSFASWVIRKATNSQWSHVGICDGKGGFYSAVPFKGVCLQPIGTMERKAACRVTDIADSQREIIQILCEENLGKPYDFKQVILVWWRLIMHKLDKYHGDPNPGKFECAEFVAEMFDKVGIRFGKIIDNVLPETIWASPLVKHL
jgi:hypothetical protein